ncbi:MAG: metal-dependent hydrolase [Planctomycetota bacterium]
MADFKTHIATSTAIGVAYGAGAYAMYDLPWATCTLAGALCSVSGMLPDLDSGPGRPLRESMAFAAAVIPMMLTQRLQALGLSHEELVLAGAALYCIVRFGGTALLQSLTVHRGVFHSIPAAILFGEAAFLMASGDDVYLRAFKAGGVTLGYLSHLVLDEFFSVEWRGGRWQFKRSFGTALKLFGTSWLPNLILFTHLGLLSWVVVNEPNWFQEFRQHRAEQIARRRAIIEQLEERGVTLPAPPADMPTGPVPDQRQAGNGWPVLSR